MQRWWLVALQRTVWICATPATAGHCSYGKMGQSGLIPRACLWGFSPTAVRPIQLDPGDSIVLYSDGITEAQDPEGNAFEEEGLIRSLYRYAEGDAIAMTEGVLRDVAGFRDTRPQQDDMTWLIVRRH